MKNNNKLKCLLGVELYELSGGYIHKLRESRRNPEELFEFLPAYTINTNDGMNNQLIETDYFLQFTGMSTNEDGKYLLFNLDTLDQQLAEEISNDGIPNVFKGIDFEKILSVFIPHNDDDHRHFVFSNRYYLVVELEYVGGYCEGVWELDDTLVNIIGYLDPNTLEIKRIL